MSISRRTGRAARVLAGLAAVLVAGAAAMPVAVAEEIDESESPSLSTAPPSPPSSSSTAPVESESPEPGGPDVKVEASAADGTYLIGEEVPVTVTITNIGDADAEGVIGRARGMDDLSFSVSSWH